MKPHLRVVTAAIFKENKLLICQRSEKMILSGYYEFPGGKVESGESDDEAVAREIKEELDMIVEVGELIAQTSYEYEDFSLDLLTYKCKTDDKPKMIEHSDMKWIAVSELDRYSFPPANTPIISKIKEMYE